MTFPDSSLPVPPSDANRGLVVLVVDDEVVIRRVVQLALASVGHVVVEAEDKASADRLIRSAGRRFDLVLLDRTLPDGEGTALVPLIRRDSPGTRILVVSGLGEMEASSVGADGYLAKPFTRVSLLAAVQLALERDTPA